MQERQREQASSSSATAKRPKMEVKEEAEAPVLHTSGQATSPPLPATFSRPPPTAMSPAAASKSEEDGWYKAALAKAQAIAKNMAQPLPAKIGTAENGPAPWIIYVHKCLPIHFTEPVEVSQPKVAVAEKKATLIDPFVTAAQQKAVPPQAQSTSGASTEENDWYKAALAKAQAIAKNMSSPPKSGKRPSKMRSCSWVFCRAFIFAAFPGATSLPGVDADSAAKTEGESLKA